MKKAELKQQDFQIMVDLNGIHEKVMVNPEETTDGAEYFKCTLKGKNITQIRQEKDGDWEQIWGDLDHHLVNTIGAAITEKKRKAISK